MWTLDDAFKALIGPETFTAEGAGGELNPEQANRFIDFMVDEQIILKECRVDRMTTNQKNLDKLGIASRILRKRIPATETAGIGATTSQKILRTIGTKLTVEIPYDSLDINIERGKFVDHFMQLCAVQIGNDLEDLGLNGDESSEDEFISINDGWYKLALANNNTYDASGDGKKYLEKILPGLVADMPDKFKKKKKDLRFYVSSAMEEGYIKECADAGFGVASFQVLTGAVVPTYMQIPLIGVPNASTSYAILTHPKTLAFGIKVTGLTREFAKDIRKGTIVAVFNVDIDYEIVEDTALVIAHDIE